MPPMRLAFTTSTRRGSTRIILSFDDVVRGRMCDTCRAKIGQEVEERAPVFDKATGRMRFEVRHTTYGSDPLKCIREHCGRAKNYVHRDMPTLEAIFRIFLANGNHADEPRAGARTIGRVVPRRRLPVAAAAPGNGRAPGPERQPLRTAPDRSPRPPTPELELADVQAAAARLDGRVHRTPC